MFQFIKKGFSHPLISGGFIVTAGVMIGNFFSLLFHLVMGRMLSVGDYGLLSSLISVFVVANVAIQTIQTAVAKFVSTYKARREEEKISYFVRLMLARIGIGVFLFYLLSQPFLPTFKAFLHIDDIFLLQITLLGILATAVGVTFVGALQGLVQFLPLAAISGSSGALRLLLGGLLVYLGYGLRGAILGFFLSFIIPYFLSFIPVRLFLKRVTMKRNLINLREVTKYALPSFVALLGVNLFMSQDIVLVRHFFTEFDAGLYSAASVTGRIVYFATFALGTVLFPLASEKYEKGKNPAPLFITSLLLLGGVSTILLILYFARPGYVISLLYSRNEYQQAVEYVGLMGLFFALVGVVNLMTNFFLSIRWLKAGLFTIGASLAQAILIWLFHESLRQVVYSSIIAVSLLIVLLAGYYLNTLKK